MRKARICKPLGHCARVAQQGSLGCLACEKMKVLIENIFLVFILMVWTNLSLVLLFGFNEDLALRS